MHAEIFLVVGVFVTTFICPGFLIYSGILWKAQIPQRTINLATLVSLSFSFSLVGLVAVYFCSYGNSLIALRVYIYIINLVSVVAILFSRKRLLLNFVSSLNSSDVTVYAIFAALFIVVATVQGTCPILFSDTWGHLTIVNRLLRSDSTLFTSGFFPNEIYLLTFAPWHAILAAFCSILKFEPLEIWRITQVILPFLLTLSYFSFLNQIYPPARSNAAYKFIFGALFVLLFPGVFQLLRGESDYRVVNSILLFQAFRLFWIIWNDKEKVFQSRNTIILLLICLTMSLVHLVEAGFFSMIVLSYGGLSFCFKKNKGLKSIQLLVLGAWLLICQLGVLKFFFSSVPSPHSVTSYEIFQDSLWAYWKTYLGEPSIVALVVLPFVVLRLPCEQSIWLSVCVLIGSILGSYNPILYPIYSGLMTSQLAWRTIMLYPSYLVLGIFCCQLFDDKEYAFKAVFKSLGIAAVSLSIGTYIFTLWGLNGEASYFWSDKISAVKLYPKFFEFVKSQDSKIFLGDPFTSVPISAISSNFAVSHRPWNNADVDRQKAHLLIQPDLSNAELREVIKKYRINFVFINQAPTPTLLIEEQKKYPQLYRFKQPDITTLPDYLVSRGTFDGIHVFEARF